MGKTREKGSKHVELEYGRKGARNLWTLSPKLPVLKVVSPPTARRLVQRHLLPAPLLWMPETDLSLLPMLLNWAQT